jgi:2-polyprenyl-3-methyl-5-hydroxy-6-metoxy-1,4-benzoquinol methylase
MLGPNFPRGLVTEKTNRYILSQRVVDEVYGQNSQSRTGPEHRLQEVYGDEIWLKLLSLGIQPAWWSGKRVLDICCGTGFLSYHLLARSKPAHLTMLDISEAEVDEARRLVSSTYPNHDISCVRANVINSGYESGAFDVVVGNSFLHHFPEVNLALREIARLLKPQGTFIALHEPKPAAIALESRNPLNWLSYFWLGDNFIDRLRPDGVSLPSCQGGDVWLFPEEDLRALLGEAGFVDIRHTHWHLLRPLWVAVLGCCPSLEALSRAVLAGSIRVDAVLRRCLPPTFFSSMATIARKGAP